jgi:uncharacterized protein YkwD
MEVSRSRLILVAVGVGCFGWGMVTMKVISNTTTPEVTTYAYQNIEPEPTPEPTATPTPTPDQHATWTYDNLLIRFNEMRLANGLTMLSSSNYLAEQAEKSLEGNCPVTGHSNFRKLGDLGVFRQFNKTSENLASGVFTPQQAIEGLMNSPTHKASMTSPELDILGIGLATEKGTNCVSFIMADRK